MKGSFVLDTTYTLVSTFGQAFTSMLSSIVLSRILGPEGKGAYSFLIFFASAMVVFGGLGISVANTYLSGRERNLFGAIVSNAIVLSTGLGLVLVLVSLILFYSFHEVYFNGVQASSFIIAVIAIPFVLIWSNLNAALIGIRKTTQYSFIAFIPAGLTCLSILVLGILHSLSIQSVLTAWTGSYVVASITVVWFVSREVPLNIQVNAAVLKETLNFGFNGYISSIMTYLNYRLDIFIVKGFLSFTSVGFYSVAVSVAEITGYLASSASTILFPRTVSSSLKEANTMTPLIFRQVLVLSIIVALGIGIGGQTFMGLIFGTQFTKAISPMWILLPGIVALGGSRVISADLVGRGKPGYATITSSVAVILTVILDLLLVPRFGINGAALASTLVYGTLLGLSLGWFCHETGLNLAEFVPRFEDLLVWQRKLRKILRSTYKMGGYDGGSL